MKKILLTAAAAVMCIASVSAQGFDWGFKGGLNLATVTKIDNANMKPTFYVGAFANFNVIDDILDIQPEVLYSRQGFKDGDLYARLNYINIPILAKLHLIDNLTLDLGPQFGIMLNSKAKAKINGTTIKSDIDGMKNFDVSFAMGLSYRIIPALDVNTRYNLGLTKLNDDWDKAKNGVVQIGVGYWW